MPLTGPQQGVWDKLLSGGQSLGALDLVERDILATFARSGSSGFNELQVEHLGRCWLKNPSSSVINGFNNKNQPIKITESVDINNTRYISATLLTNIQEGEFYHFIADHLSSLEIVIDPEFPSEIE